MKDYKILPVYILFIISLFYSCSKGTITDITPPSPTDTTTSHTAADSAQLIFVNSADPSDPAHNYALTAYDPFKNKKWEFAGTTPPDSKGINTCIDGSLFVTSSDFVLQSMDPATGVANWTNSSFKSMLTLGFLISDQSLHDTVVAATSTLAPSNKNTLALISKSTGNIFWSKVVSDQPLIPPVLSEGKIYCFTTNFNGTNMVLSSYDVATKNLVWQKTISNSFLMSIPAPMILRNDTIIVGSSTKSINLINKNNGNIIWSQLFNNTNNVYLYGNEIIYNDFILTKVITVSLQTGSIIRQSDAIPYSRFSGTSYIYDNCFYNKVNDSLFCTNLVDGTVKWRKITPINYYYSKLTCIGNTVYGVSSQTISIPTPSRINVMILNAKDFSAKDSIAPSLRSVNISLLSTSGKYYK